MLDTAIPCKCWLVSEIPNISEGSLTRRRDPDASGSALINKKSYDFYYNRRTVLDNTTTTIIRIIKELE